MLFYRGVEFLKRKSEKPALELPKLPEKEDLAQVKKFFRIMGELLENPWPNSEDFHSSVEYLAELSEEQANLVEEFLLPKWNSVLLQSLDSSLLQNTLDITMTIGEHFPEALNVKLT